MHEQAYSWVASHATADRVAVLDIGGRDINGTVRGLFPGATVYTCLDILPGEGVDIIADAATWVPDREYDVVVCCEVFEHTDVWPQICQTAHKALKPGGKFIATMAGPGRPPHSAIDGGWALHPGEHYGNVTPAELHGALAAAGFGSIVVDRRDMPADTRAVAVKPA